MLSAAEVSLPLTLQGESFMEETVFRALYKQFLFFSDNGKAPIENPAIAMSEACKCCGRPREEIREALIVFEKHGIVKRASSERLLFTMTETGLDSVIVEEIISRLSMK